MPRAGARAPLPAAERDGRTSVAADGTCGQRLQRDHAVVGPLQADF